MRQFIQWVQSTRSLSDRTINAIISQLRFFTMYVLHKPWDNTQLPMRRFDTYLPYVPTTEEVKLFINTLPTLKQKTMVALMYSAGLRVGEVCNLRYSDIKRSSMRIHVAQAKNRSDRYAILSQKSLDMLTDRMALSCQTGFLQTMQNCHFGKSGPAASQKTCFKSQTELSFFPPCFWHSLIRSWYRSAHY